MGTIEYPKEGQRNYEEEYWQAQRHIDELYQERHARGEFEKDE